MIPGLGSSPGEGKGYPLQHSGLENSKDYTVRGVAKGGTQLSNFHFTFTSLGYTFVVISPRSSSKSCKQRSLCDSFRLLLVELVFDLFRAKQNKNKDFYPMKITASPHCTPGNQNMSQDSSCDMIQSNLLSFGGPKRASDPLCPPASLLPYVQRSSGIC